MVLHVEISEAPPGVCDCASPPAPSLSQESDGAGGDAQAQSQMKVKRVFRPCDGSKQGVWVFDRPLELPHPVLRPVAGPELSSDCDSGCSLRLKANVTLTPLEGLEPDELQVQGNGQTGGGPSPSELDRARGCQVRYDFTVVSRPQMNRFGPGE